MPVKSELSQVLSAMNMVEADLKKLVNMQFIKRLLRKDDIADTITRHTSRVSLLLQLFQAEASMDVAARLVADSQARADDTAKLDMLLVESSASERRLTELVEVGNRGTREELAKIKDLLHLCARQLQACPPGGADRMFYAAMWKKMNTLSGGKIPRAPHWIVSQLEIDRDEGVCHTAQPHLGFVADMRSHR